ncbi:ADP-ribose pyrophosphatase [Edwardsiella tarda]|nr:ADP-ribose pyrophosphatase [Edwardsiella tarda]
MSGEVVREVFERGHAAVLLPYDPRRDEVVLIEQLRIPAYDSSATPWLLEMVAGMIEPGESVEQVARREALEEAGITVGRCRPVLSYLASPGGPASVSRSSWGRLTPARHRVYMAWPKSMRIFGYMW